MLQTSIFHSFDVLDMTLLFLSCVLILVNFVFGGFITISLLFRCIVDLIQREEMHPSYSGYFGFWGLALICFGVGIRIFDLQISGELKCGTMIVEVLWSLVFSVAFLEASAFVFVSEIKKLRRTFHG